MRCRRAETDGHRAANSSWAGVRRFRLTLPASSANPVIVTLAGANIPPGTPVIVTVTGQTGGSSSVSATLGGTMASTTGSVALIIPTNRPSIVSAAATFTLMAGNGSSLLAQLTTAAPDLATLEPR